jgi:hypothetical protein
MPRLLTTVEHTVVLPSHGIGLFPGIVPVGEERFRIGSVVLLRRPDGSEIPRAITGIELPTPNPRREIIFLFKGLGKSDIPLGTQVWSTVGG